MSADKFTAMAPSSSSSTTSSSLSKESKTVSTARVHGALIVVQVFFGCGSVVGSLGLPSFNPMVFALIREVCAGALLVGASVATSQLWPWHMRREHLPRFFLLGVMIFGNQAGFIVGIKLSTAVAASIWQPSQPIMTCAICMALGWEPVIPRRILGIAVAFVGCALMVTLDATGGERSARRCACVSGSCSSPPCSLAPGRRRCH